MNSSLLVTAIFFFSLQLTVQSASISKEMDKMSIEPENNTQMDKKKPYNDLKKRSKARYDPDFISRYISSFPQTSAPIPQTQRRVNFKDFLDLRPPVYTNEYGNNVPDFDEYVDNVQSLITKLENKVK